MPDDQPATDHPVVGPFLLTIIVPFFRHEGNVFVESQALNGLRRWQSEFGDMIVAAPLKIGPPPKGWVPLPKDDPAIARIAMEFLPGNPRLREGPGDLMEGCRILSRCIDRAGAICFSIGGLIIDWGALGALIARRRHRDYAVWADRVESEVVRVSADERTGLRALRRRSEARVMEALERHVISRAQLGLFHGADTFDAYAALPSHPFLVHNIHLRPDEHITSEALVKKMAKPPGRSLRIVYAGRMDGMKGPLDWVDALGGLRVRGVAFQAVWYGDGEMADAMRARVEETGLADVISLPGIVTDRQVIMDALRAADLLLFCHKTRESPRILIEALASGTPIVGYASRYAADLVREHGGGSLVPIGDVAGLAQAVTDIAKDPDRLPNLVRGARRSGEGYTDVAVFRHRSSLIKRYLVANQPELAN